VASRVVARRGPYCSPVLESKCSGVQGHPGNSEVAQLQNWATFGGPIIPDRGVNTVLSCVESYRGHCNPISAFSCKF
jgi:hypothetical protein